MFRATPVSSVEPASAEDTCKRLINEAVALQNNGNFTAALKSYKQAQPLVQSLNINLASEMTGKIHIGFSYCYFIQNNNVLTKAHIKAALRILVEPDSATGYWFGHCLKCILPQTQEATILQTTINYLNIVVMEECATLRDFVVTTNHGVLTQILAQQYHKSKDWVTAEATYQRAIDILELYPLHNPSLLANTFHSLGKLHMARTALTQGMSSLLSSLERYQACSNKEAVNGDKNALFKTIFSCLHSILIGGQQYISENKASLIAILDKTLKIFEIEPYQAALVRIKNYIAFLFVKLNYYDQAIPLMGRTLADLMENQADSTLLGTAYLSLTQCHLVQSENVSGYKELLDILIKTKESSTQAIDFYSQEPDVNEAQICSVQSLQSYLYKHLLEKTKKIKKKTALCLQLQKLQTDLSLEISLAQRIEPYFLLHQVYTASKSKEKASEQLKQVGLILSQVDEHVDQIELGRLHFRLAELYSKIEDKTKAIHHFEMVLIIELNAPYLSYEETTDTQLQLARMHQALQALPNAITYYESILEYYIHYDTPADVELIDSLHQLATCYFEQRNYETCIERCELAIKKLKELSCNKKTALQFAITMLLTKAHYNQGEFEACIAHYKGSLKNKSFNSHRPMLLQRMADCYYQSNELKTAYKYFLKCAQETDKDSDKTSCYIAMADILMVIEPQKPNKAIKCYTEALTKIGNLHTSKAYSILKKLAEVCKAANSSAPLINKIKIKKVKLIIKILVLHEKIDKTNKRLYSKSGSVTGLTQQSYKSLSGLHASLLKLTLSTETANAVTASSKNSVPKNIALSTEVNTLAASTETAAEADIPEVRVLSDAATSPDLSAVRLSARLKAPVARLSKAAYCDAISQFAGSNYVTNTFRKYFDATPELLTMNRQSLQAVLDKAHNWETSSIEQRELIHLEIAWYVFDALNLLEPFKLFNTARNNIKYRQACLFKNGMRKEDQHLQFHTLMETARILCVVYEQLCIYSKDDDQLAAVVSELLKLSEQIRRTHGPLMQMSDRNIATPKIEISHTIHRCAEILVNPQAQAEIATMARILCAARLRKASIYTWEDLAPSSGNSEIIHATIVYFNCQRSRLNRMSHGGKPGQYPPIQGVPAKLLKEAFAGNTGKFTPDHRTTNRLLLKERRRVEALNTKKASIKQALDKRGLHYLYLDKALLENPGFIEKLEYFSLFWDIKDYPTYLLVADVETMNIMLISLEPLANQYHKTDQTQIVLRACCSYSEEFPVWLTSLIEEKAGQSELSLAAKINHSSFALAFDGSKESEVESWVAEAMEKLHANLDIEDELNFEACAASSAVPPTHQAALDKTSIEPDSNIFLLTHSPPDYDLSPVELPTATREASYPVQAATAARAESPVFEDTMEAAAGASRAKPMGLFNRGQTPGFEGFTGEPNEDDYIGGVLAASSLLGKSC